MKQWTDSSICRHYRFKEKGYKQSYFEITEYTSVEDEIVVFLKDETLLDEDCNSCTGVTNLTRRQAKQLGKLLLHFAEHGQLPVPRKQDPPKDVK